MLTKKFEEKSRLGKILVKRQYISEQELTQALAYQATHDLRIGEALMALNLITPLQLKRALRRQSWLRSIATGVTLVAAPFTPAFAESNGSLGSTSITSSHISLTISPKSQSQGKGELSFTSNHQATERGFCSSEMGVDLFRIKLTGSAAGGAFKVSNRQNAQLAYQVSYKHQQETFQPLQANVPSRMFSNLSSEKNCQQAFSNQLKVAFAKRQLGENPSQTYNGVLTLTLAVE